MDIYQIILYNNRIWNNSLIGKLKKAGRKRQKNKKSGGDRHEDVGQSGSRAGT